MALSIRSASPVMHYTCPSGVARDALPFSYAHASPSFSISVISGLPLLIRRGVATDAVIGNSVFSVWIFLWSGHRGL